MQGSHVKRSAFHTLPLSEPQMFCASLKQVSQQHIVVGNAPSTPNTDVWSYTPLHRSQFCYQLSYPQLPSFQFYTSVFHLFPVNCLFNCVFWIRISRSRQLIFLNFARPYFSWIFEKLLYLHTFANPFQEITVPEQLPLSSYLWALHGTDSCWHISWLRMWLVELAIWSLHQILPLSRLISVPKTSLMSHTWALLTRLT